MKNTNYFAHDTVAHRYAYARPYFHPIVMQHIRHYLKLDSPLETALDVACGTGHSSIALKAIARRVYGAELASSMLAHVIRESEVEYVQAAAENLPFPDESIDLMTVCMALHWLDRAAFLQEAYRLLRSSPSGTLVIYNNRFRGIMRENPDFEIWHRDVYIQRYPPPRRKPSTLTAEYAARHGFHYLKEQDYTNNIIFTVRDLAVYLSTQSNLIAVIEEGHESLEAIQDWLVASIRPFFNAPTGTFVFNGRIDFFKKAET